MLNTSNAFDPAETSTVGEMKTSMFNEYDIVHIVFCIVLSVLILVSNAFIMFVLRKGRYCFDEATSFLFQILAFTNIAGGAAGALIHALYFVFITKPISDTICRIVPSFITYFSFSSLYLVCLINAQRYFAVTRPFKYMRLATVNRFKIIVCVAKIFVTCLTIVMLPIKGFPFTAVFALTCQDGYGTGVAISNVETKIGITVMVVAIGLPLLTLSAVNYRLLVIAYRASQRLPPIPRRSQDTSTNHKDIFKIDEANSKMTLHRHAAFQRGLKGLKTVVVISVLFYVSCIPYVVSLVLTVIRGEQSYYLYLVSIGLLLSNCWWNSLVYFFTSKTFRQKSLEVLGVRMSRSNAAEASTRESSYTQNENNHYITQST